MRQRSPTILATVLLLGIVLAGCKQDGDQSAIQAEAEVSGASLTATPADPSTTISSDSSTTVPPGSSKDSPTTTEFPDTSRPFRELNAPDQLMRTQTSFEVRGSGCANTFLSTVLLDEQGQLRGSSQQETGAENTWVAVVNVHLSVDDVQESSLVVSCRGDEGTEAKQVLVIPVVG